MDDWVGLVLWLQHDPALFAVQPLQREFVVQDCDDNVADFFYFSNRRRNIEGVSMANRVCLATAKSA